LGLGDPGTILNQYVKIKQKRNSIYMGEKVEQFNEYRSRMNDRILSTDNKVVKRIFNVDTNAYTEGALSVKTKELMGLVASLVLRCDDCVRYHLLKCRENNVTEEELFEVLGIATLVGGTIVVPHMRRAVEFWDDMHV
jgi:AhpD family alkylhydroperoxidase